MIPTLLAALFLAILWLYPHWILGSKYKKVDPKKEPKVYEPTFVLENEDPNCKLSKLIDHSVNKTVKYLNECYFDSNKADIWTNSIYNFQLKLKLERMVKLNYTHLSEEKVEEMVRDIIKLFHLRTIAKYPELKEYK